VSFFLGAVLTMVLMMACFRFRGPSSTGAHPNSPDIHPRAHHSVTRPSLHISTMDPRVCTNYDLHSHHWFSLVSISLGTSSGQWSWRILSRIRGISCMRIL
jgi:hypothetical protein